jgi:hypothetical protein
MDQSIKAGAVGFALAVIINLFLPTSLPTILQFVPSFLAAIIAIFIFKVGTFKDGLVTTLMTYFFNDATLNLIGFAYYYFEKKQVPPVDASTVVYPVIEAVTVIIAAYVGARLVQSMKPPKESLSPLTVRPPSL